MWHYYSNYNLQPLLNYFCCSLGFCCYLEEYNFLSFPVTNQKFSLVGFCPIGSLPSIKMNKNTLFLIIIFFQNRTCQQCYSFWYFFFLFKLDILYFFLTHFLFYYLDLKNVITNKHMTELILVCLKIFWRIYIIQQRYQFRTFKFNLEKLLMIKVEISKCLGKILHE